MIDERYEGPGRVALRILGSGDAFGGAGRFQPCMLLEGDEGHLLVDCGSTSLLAMVRRNVDPREIAWAAVTQLDPPHAGGVPLLVAERGGDPAAVPLTLGGPPGFARCLEAALGVQLGRAVEPARQPAVLELSDEVVELGAARIRACALRTPPDVACALRIEFGGRILAYTSGGPWTRGLIDLARGADLFVCEAHSLEPLEPSDRHIDVQTLRDHLQDLQCGRVLLAQPGPEVLAVQDELDLPLCGDGDLVLL